jgi:hypothetical protein
MPAGRSSSSTTAPASGTPSQSSRNLPQSAGPRVCEQRPAPRAGQLFRARWRACAALHDRLGIQFAWAAATRRREPANAGHGQRPPGSSQAGKVSRGDRRIFRCP